METYFDWLPQEMIDLIWYWVRRLGTNDCLREIALKRELFSQIAKKSYRWRSIELARGSHAIIIGNNVVLYRAMHCVLEPQYLDFWDKNLYADTYRLRRPDTCVPLYSCKWIDHDAEFHKLSQEDYDLYREKTSGRKL